MATDRVELFLVVVKTTLPPTSETDAWTVRRPRIRSMSSTRSAAQEIAQIPGEGPDHHRVPVDEGRCPPFALGQEEVGELGIAVQHAHRACIRRGSMALNRP